jgi:hypothetical protein
MIMRPGFLAILTALVIAVPSPCHAQASSSPTEHVVTIVAEDHAFYAPAEIPSGWTTFRLRNEGEETHFAIVSRLPEGKILDDYIEEMGTQFAEVVHAVRTGRFDKAEGQQHLNEILPAWAGSLERLGGPGLLAGGRTAETALKLEPGNYFIECYLKTADGDFHAMKGMARPLTVTEEVTEAPEPEADVRLTLSNDGITVEGKLMPGRQTVAVHFAEHPEAGYPQHDVHLAQLGEGIDASQVVPWMDWLEADGFVNPAPVEFVGGTHEMPAGSVAYVTMDLESGRYAWISQMTGAMGLVKAFTVEPRSSLP